MNLNICVTGFTGFIGSNLVKELQKNIDNKISVIVRSKNDFIKFNNDKLICHIDDGTNKKLIDFFKKSKFDIVIHLASLCVKDHKEEDIYNIINSNILFGTRLLEACALSSVKTFINTGTFWQYYGGNTYNPVNLYSASKEAFESMAKYYCECHDLTFITLYLNDTYGPGDTRNKILNIWNSMENNQELMMSPGNQKINILYITDVITGYLNLISKIKINFFKKSKMYKYVLKSNEDITLKQLYLIFEKISGKKLNIVWGGYDYKKRETMKIWNGGQIVPGWKNQISLKNGIKNFLGYLKKNEN